MSPRKHPLTIPEPEFQALVQEALDGLPDEYAKLLTNVAVVVEEEPPLRMCSHRSRVGGRVRICSVSIKAFSIDKESFFQAGGQLPAKISIYRGPILRLCRTKKEVVQEVRDTVVHEIGHHFGFDDDEMPY
jgi:predicted Zn-dependent protease with MMP-like domain